MKITLDGARAGTVEFVANAGRSCFRTIVLTNDSEDAQLFKVLFCSLRPELDCNCSVKLFPSCLLLLRFDLLWNMLSDAPLLHWI